MLARFGRDDEQAEARQDALLRSRRAAVIIHGDHPLDPVAAAMLAHGLARRGLPNRTVSPETARAASVAERDAVGLICLCYIEPLTIAHLRAAVREARQSCPTAKVLVCLWRDPTDDSVKGLDRRIRCDALATGVGAAGAAALGLLGLKADRRAQARRYGFAPAARRGASAR